MKKYNPLLAVCLLVCLFIYVFYRTDKTLVNQVIIAICSRENYNDLKKAVTAALPLNDYFIYSLPEGLWVFCITLTSSFFYIGLQKRKWSLVFVPVLIAVILEIFQLLHLTNGRFDLMDIGFSVGFWAVAFFWTRTSCVKEPLFQSFDHKTISCVSSYSIVYLAHVIT